MASVAVKHTVYGDGKQWVDVEVLNNDKGVFHIASAAWCCNDARVVFFEQELVLGADLDHGVRADRVVLALMQLHEDAVGVFVVEGLAQQVDRLPLINNSEFECLGLVALGVLFHDVDVQLLLVFVVVGLVGALRAEYKVFHAVELELLNELVLLGCIARIVLQ